MKALQILKILGIVFLGTAEGPYSIAMGILYIVGLWGMFRKSGVDPRWALVPCAREYMLACCAGREPEGRVTSVTQLFQIFFGLLSVPAVSSLRAGLLNSAPVAVMLSVLMFSTAIVYVVFSVRVAVGVLEVYGLRRRWIALWIVAEGLATCLIGWRGKYQPAWKVPDYRREMSEVASHGSAAVMDEGLTVNLKSRTVTEFFRRKVLLRDIHLGIPRGHMVLLLGGSGAGKTTFVNAVNGYEPADAEIMLNGENLYKQYRKLQHQIGFVPQQELLRGKDTVQATLMDTARLRLPADVTAQDRRRRVEEVMEIFGLNHMRSHLAEKLSGGQKKRLSIAMEFISNPSLFILDEPDSGLDGVMARELMEQLRAIADAGRIVIVITHTPDRVIDLFDDVIVLAKDELRTGRLAFCGSIEKARAFFGRERMEEIVKAINRREEGGDGLADEFIAKFAEVQYG